MVVVGCENYRRLKLVPEMVPLLGHRQLGAGEGVTLQAHDPGCGPRSGGPVLVRTRGKCASFTTRSICLLLSGAPEAQQHQSPFEIQQPNLDSSYALPLEIFLDLLGVVSI